MFDWLEGYSVQETRRQVREEERQVWTEELRQVREEERRVWEEKLRQTEAVLQERIRHLEQVIKEQGLRL
jgi:hypothetical protein